MSDSENENAMLMAMDWDAPEDSSDQLSVTLSEGSIVHDDDDDDDNDEAAGISEDPMTPDEIPDVEYNGFVCSMGRILALPLKVERVPDYLLRTAFLPQTTSVGQQYMQDQPDFIRHQLTHYGVYVKNAVLDHKTKSVKAFQDALRDGLCDSVPHFMLRIQATLHRLWIDNLGDELRFLYPHYLIRDRFLTADKPDRGKTIYPVSFHFDSENTMDVADNLRAVAGGIEGLHCISRYGAWTQVVVIGWSLKAVTKDATRWAADEFRMEAQRALNLITVHENYLANIVTETKYAVYRKWRKQRENDPSTPEPSKYANPNPIGTYLLVVDAIEGEHAEMAQKLLLHFTETPITGVYDSLFHFGKHEGLVVIAKDKQMLMEYFEGFKKSNRRRVLKESEPSTVTNPSLRNKKGFRYGFRLRARRKQHSTAAVTPRPSKPLKRVTRSKTASRKSSGAPNKKPMKGKEPAKPKGASDWLWVLFSTPTHREFAAEEKLLPNGFSDEPPPTPNLQGKVLRQALHTGRCNFSKDCEYFKAFCNLDAVSRRVHFDGLKIGDQHWNGAKNYVEVRPYLHPELN
ncbi:hypothetical protein GGR57DRAFT_513113 [Xylariaceae sp. FL1272]|nr:hypothetical protein GGR57DRAFT_513113 [Xylariaceae sp. FL1272]